MAARKTSKQHRHPDTGPRGARPRQRSHGRDAKKVESLSTAKSRAGTKAARAQRVGDAAFKKTYAGKAGKTSQSKSSRPSKAAARTAYKMRDESRSALKGGNRLK